MSNQGWVKLHRKLLDTSFAKKPSVGWLFICLLLKANHDDNKFLFNGEELVVKSGQLITGVYQLSKDTGLSVMQVRYGLKCLKVTNTLTIKTTNKFSIITIQRWNEYQDINKQINKPVTNKQQTNNKQTTTNNNDNTVKNDKNEKNNTLAPVGADLNKLIGMFKAVNPFYERLYANRTQRMALERMVAKFGEEKMAGLIEHLPGIMAKPYAPQITTPSELEAKMGRLVQFMRQEQLKVSKMGVTKL